MPAALTIDPGVIIPDDEIELSFVRASGPGGQNVNKVATAVQLHFDVDGSRVLDDAVKARLKRLGGQRITTQGVLIIKANRYRTQERNRDDALERLAELVRAALAPPRIRKKTKVPKSAQRRRLQNKQQRSRVKAARNKHRVADD